MATIAAWEKDIDKLQIDERKELIRALDTLRNWPLFDQNFSELHSIKSLLQISLMKDCQHNTQLLTKEGNQITAIKCADCGKSLKDR